MGNYQFAWLPWVYIKKNIRGCMEAKAIVYQSIHFEGGTMFEQLGEIYSHLDGKVWRTFP